MLLRQVILLTGTLLSALPASAKYEAHEWGTFTSLVGSNGKTQNGMYHEDEALPAFVYGFGETAPSVSQPAPMPTPSYLGRKPCHGKGCIDMNFLKANVITQKMETPVIYFYTDKTEHIDVNVRFPEGVITETFPAPIRTSPQKSPSLVLENGDTTFSVDVLPQTYDVFPAVDRTNIYSHARNVASHVVRSGRDIEKFIFYRGLGRFQPAMEIRSTGGALSLKADAINAPQAAFLVHVNESGHGNIAEIKFSGSKGASAGDVSAQVAATVIQQLKDHTRTHEGLGISGSSIFNATQGPEIMLPALVRAGLFKDEAKAMLETWKNGYLRTPGLRLLYVLPRAEVDRTLPITMTPAPEKLERVFVGRIEIMLDTDEARILKDVATARENFRVASLGRFAEPMLRRVLDVYSHGSSVHADPSLAGVLVGLIDAASAAAPAEGTSGSVH